MLSEVKSCDFSTVQHVLQQVRQTHEELNEDIMINYHCI